MVDSLFFTEKIEEIHPFSEKATPNYILAFKGWYGKDIEELDISLRTTLTQKQFKGICFFYLHSILHKAKYDCISMTIDRNVYHTYSIRGPVTLQKGPAESRGTFNVVSIPLNKKERFLCTVKDVLTYNV